MCRLCGRIVKCIFDSMPSRTMSFSNRITLLSMRRHQQTTRTFASLPQLSQFTPVRPHRSSPPTTSLTKPLSCLSLRPSLSFPSTTPPSPAATQTSQFSTTATLGQKRWTYNPSRRVQKRRHGFLARSRSADGIKILKRRRAKGRKNLSW